MNTEILKRLSYEQLKELKEATEKEMGTRMDFSVRVGRTGHFVDGHGVERRCRVTRINSKSITVMDLSNPLKGWRISSSAFIMDGVPFTEKTKSTTPSTSPAETYNIASW